MSAIPNLAGSPLNLIAIREEERKVLVELLKRVTESFLFWFVGWWGQMPYSECPVEQTSDDGYGGCFSTESNIDKDVLYFRIVEWRPSSHSILQYTLFWRKTLSFS